jgi:uncharacterized PurR-regulated membrane protein YhhQ (DUF165 family)
MTATSAAANVEPIYRHHARTIGMVAVALYVATIFAANWAIERFGIVSVGFGLTAPAGVYFVGLAFTLRDITHDTLGRRWVLGAIVGGALLSWIVTDNPELARASAAAFLFSELLDFAVYTPLRERHWIGAVLLSNLVGLVADSVIFLWLAFDSLEFLEGQIVGKTWMTLLAVGVLSIWRRLARRESWA